MDARLVEVLALGPVSVREAVALGVPRGSLRSSRLTRPIHGVRSLGDAEVVDAVIARMDPAHFLSHVSAARMWGIRLPGRLRSRPIDVSAIVPHHAPRTAGIAPHRLHDDHVELALVDGVRITTPTETWRHLSTVLDFDELVIAGDSLVRRVRPLASERELVRALARHSGARGVRRLRAAHVLVRPGTDSAPETRLRLMLTRAGLPEPRVNAPLELPGYGSAFADLSYPDLRVAIEYDGRQHRTDAGQFERDIRRLEAFAVFGWTVVRVIGPHLADPDAVVARVRRVMLANDRF